MTGTRWNPVAGTQYREKWQNTVPNTVRTLLQDNTGPSAYKQRHLTSHHPHTTDTARVAALPRTQHTPPLTPPPARPRCVTHTSSTRTAHRQGHEHGATQSQHSSHTLLGSHGTQRRHAADCIDSHSRHEHSHTLSCQWVTARLPLFVLHIQPAQHANLLYTKPQPSMSPLASA